MPRNDAPVRTFNDNDIIVTITRMVFITEFYSTGEVVVGKKRLKHPFFKKNKMKPNGSLKRSTFFDVLEQKTGKNDGEIGFL